MGELSFANLLDQADALVAAEAPDPADLGAFAVGVREVAASLSPEELHRLHDAFERVRAAAHREQERLRQRMEQAGSGRRALRGYGSLRSTKRCQRASRYS